MAEIKEKMRQTEDLATSDGKRIRNALNAALNDLVTYDEYLLKVGASERSISHRLAVHLTNYFPDHDVDCEFNRDGFNIKKLMLSAEQTWSDEAMAVTVFPDVIVHQRGHAQSNLLVVEVKKCGYAPKDFDFDAQKLRGFMDALGYKCAAHVVVGFENGQPKTDVKWLPADGQ